MSRRYHLLGLSAGFAAGVAAIVLQPYSGVVQGPQTVTPVPPSAAAIAPAPEPSHTAAASGVEEPALQTLRPQSVSAEDPVAALQRHTQTCVFWTQRATDQNGRAFRDHACSVMREYAARTGQAAPKIGAAPRALARKPPRAGTVLPHHGRECGQHRHGSINYRRCRARESQRLKERCRFYRQSEKREAAASWCAAYESYQVVD